MFKVSVFQEINDLHQAINSPLRTSEPSLHIFRGEDTLKSIRTEMPPHRNMFYEIGLIQQADINTSLNDSSYQLYNQPHIYCATEGQLREWKRVGAWKGLLCMFKPELLNWSSLNVQIEKKYKFFARFTPKVIPLEPYEVSRFQELFEQMYHEFYQNQGKGSELVLAYLQTILLKVQKVFDLRFDSFDNPPAQNRSEELAILFKILIEKQAINKQNLDYYAQELHISTKHLEKVVSQYFRQSPGMMIKNVILCEAKSLLFQTPLTVAEIAYQLHFEDPSYFNKFFKRYTGLTPIAYRKKHQIYL
ncbi:MAG: helix-turn-helix domain-containing protein [Bacteroidota bacterium]|nr:helix-turn-helix domain-containing protein [Bacteroidota bacterium]